MPRKNCPWPDGSSCTCRFPIPARWVATSFLADCALLQAFRYYPTPHRMKSPYYGRLQTGLSDHVRNGFWSSVRYGWWWLLRVNSSQAHILIVWLFFHFFLFHFTLVHPHESTVCVCVLFLQEWLSKKDFPWLREFLRRTSHATRDKPP